MYTPTDEIDSLLSKLFRYAISVAMGIAGIAFSGGALYISYFLFSNNVFSIALFVGLLLIVCLLALAFISFKLMKKGFYEGEVIKRTYPKGKVNHEIQQWPKKSLLVRSGQTWKMILGGTFLVIGGVLNFVSRENLDSAFYIVVLYTPLLTLIGLAIIGFGIRCPHCKAKWYWLVASERGLLERWGGSLRSFEKCPECNDTSIPIRESSP